MFVYYEQTNFFRKKIMDTFNALLKLYRQVKNITQEDLARECKFSRDYIIKLETGKRLAPPDRSVFSIANALSLSKEETLNLLESARHERLSYTFEKNRRLKVESVAECLAGNFSQDELISLTEHLQKLTAAQS
jgi:transcriptional regulator with XRE-family HTH domain